MKSHFVTITGIKNYYGFKPFRVGQILKISKDKSNAYDCEAIAAELPYIGTVGYVANSTHTVYNGTVSAGRLYDKIDDYAYACVNFITHSAIIALVIPPEEIEKKDDVKEEAEISEDEALS